MTDIFYVIYVWLLQILTNIVEAFDTLAGINPVKYNGRTMPIYDLFFTASPVAAIFWGITVVGLALAVFFSIIRITRQMADMNTEKSMSATLGHIGKSMLMFLINPLMIIALLQIVTITMNKTDELFYVANGGSYSIDSTLFAMTARNAVLENADVIYQFGNGDLRYDDAASVSEHLDKEEILYWAGIFVTLGLCVMYMFCLLIVMLRLFMLTVLYIVSPFFVSSMVLDDGVKYRAWREALFGKIFAGFSLLIAVKIIAFVVVPFLMDDIIIVDHMAGDIFLKVLLFAGCVYGSYKSSIVLIKIIAPGADDDLGSLFAGAKAAVLGAASLAGGVGAAASAAAKKLTAGAGRNEK